MIATGSIVPSLGFPPIEYPGSGGRVESRPQHQFWNPTEETELEPIPGHYKYMLGLPV